MALILDRLEIAPGDLILDPACGDGSFLRGAVAAVARRLPTNGSDALAEKWVRRIIGFDVDAEAVAHARAELRAAFLQHLGVEVREEDLLVRQADALQHPDLAPLLQSLGPPALHEVERLLVVGNPPYVEAKRLPRATKRDLKERYPEALVGAPDLYLYFLHVCLGWLRNAAADTLAFVVPNKLLVNANAQRLRENLLREERLQCLWFATQANLFPDAAVYPIVLFARAPRGPESFRDADVETRLIRRTEWGDLDGSAAVSAPAGWYRGTEARAFFPPPGTPELRDALERLLEQQRLTRLDGFLDIRWTVSFHRGGLRERYVLPQRPYDLFARPFLGGGAFSGNGEVTRYRLHWAGWWIRYAQDELSALGNPLPDVAIFERPMIVICQNGRTLRAAYDEAGHVLKDTFLCGLIRDCDHPLCRHPRALVGLLCSRAVHFFYSHVFYGGHVGGGYLHFLRSFLVDIPLGRWTEELAIEAAELVNDLEVETAADRREALENRLELLVGVALGIADDQADAIAEWAARDPNWQARERVRAPAPGSAG